MWTSDLSWRWGFFHWSFEHKTSQLVNQKPRAFHAWLNHTFAWNTQIAYANGFNVLPEGLVVFVLRTVHAGQLSVVWDFGRKGAWGMNQKMPWLYWLMASATVKDIAAVEGRHWRWQIKSKTLCKWRLVSSASWRWAPAAVYDQISLIGRSGISCHYRCREPSLTRRGRQINVNYI